MSALAHHDAESVFLKEVGVAMQVLNSDSDRVHVALYLPDEMVLPSSPCATRTAGRRKFRRSIYRLSRQEFHDLKNHLHAIRLTLHVVRRLEQAGKREAAAETNDRLVQLLGVMDTLDLHRVDTLAN